MERNSAQMISEQAAAKLRIRGMFNDIAARYDFLNHFLSLGIDILWRKKAVALLRNEKPKKILDVASGTADFALEALSLHPQHITGIDISENMLALGREKIKSKNLQDKITLLTADSENIPFADNLFDAITVGFGVRNFTDLNKGLSEMNRVLKPGGTLVVLEFSKPMNFPMKQLYALYFSSILPFIGRIVSGHTSAYTYLPESVSKFPDGQKFLDLLKETGFNELQLMPLTFGIASIYTGKKC